MAQVRAGPPDEAGSCTKREGFTLTDLSLLLTATIWGFNFVIVKAVLSVMSPLAFLGIRMTLAMVIMLLIYRLGGGSFRLQRREWLELVGLGLLGTTAYQWCFINGIDRTTVVNAALIQAALPVLVAVGRHMLKVDRLRPLAWFGVLLSFFGLYLVIQGGRTQIELGGRSLVGDLFLLGGVLAWSAYTILARPVLARHPPIRVTAIGMLGGVPPLILLSAPALQAESWRSLPWSAWLAMLYSGGLSIALAYLLWNRGVQRVGSPRTAVYTNLVPVIAVVAAFVFLGEELAWVQFAGAALIFVGILLARMRR